MLHWYIFGIIVVILLFLDLQVLHKKNAPVTLKQNILISIFYFIISCLFSIYVYIKFGAENTKEYLAGFLLEKAMALDNIFVISIIFKFFNIPLRYQQRVLLWGILGVIIFRGIIISLGNIILIKFYWLLYILAIFLILTGVKILQVQDKKFNIEEFFIYKILRKFFNMTNEIHGDDLLVKINNKLYMTPLLSALIVIEIIDVIFALDSLPVIFAITTEPFIVYSSNIFAILGLRALYFCLNNIIERFKYIKYSLGIILIFIGCKIFVNHFIKISTLFSLSIIIILLLIGLLLSITNSENQKKEDLKT